MYTHICRGAFTCHSTTRDRIETLAGMNDGSEAKLYENLQPTETKNQPHYYYHRKSASPRTHNDDDDVSYGMSRVQASTLGKFSSVSTTSATNSAL